MPHNRINLDLRLDKPNNVWRYIFAWRESTCHNDSIRYLFLHALVQWGEDRQHLETIFSIAIQYSTEIGREVDVSQPAHILEQDLPRVLEEFSAFVRERNGQR